MNEATAAGLPVIVSERCGCVSDLVEHGRNGYRFDPFDVVGLSSLMLRMASGSLEREAMGRRSREIIAKWGLSRFAEGLEAAARLAFRSQQRKAT